MDPPRDDYFEGVLQLRNPTDDAILKARDLVAKKGARIAKEKPVKGGIDLYVSSQHHLQSIGRELQKQFGGELKVSKKLHTRNKQTSRDVYRVFVMLRLPEHSAGSIIRVADKVYKVTSISKATMGIDLESGKKVKIDASKAEVLVQHTTTVSKLTPELEVLHPETYQSVTVRNPARHEIGQKVKVVVTDEHSAYLV